MVKKQAKQAAGAVCIVMSLDPEAFAREQFPEVERLAKRFARYEEYAHSRKYDAEEIAAVALPLLYERGYRAFAETFPGRKAQGYRAVRPYNAIPYAQVYGLADCAVSDSIGYDDLSGPFRRLAHVLTETELAWLFSRSEGTPLVQAARAAGKDGTGGACLEWSRRTRAVVAQKARKCGIDEFYGTYRRQFARPLPTAMPEDEDEWVAKEFQKTFESSRVF